LPRLRDSARPALRILDEFVELHLCDEFVAVVSAVFLKERLRPIALLGIGTALVGGIVIGFSDAGQGGAASTRGDLLAILGALAVCGYLLVGRGLRRRMSLALYVGISYVTAALGLLSLVALTGTWLAGYSVGGYFWVLLLAVGPQLLGHTSYNYALKYLSATFVAVTLLGEPIGATLLAIPLLSQIPSALRVAGGLFALVGILLAARAEAATKRL
jgi:drug/metabolite transporter (DMT)-like permease